MERLAKPLTAMKFGNEPITSPKVHKDYVTFNAGKYSVTLFSEGSSVVIEKRPCADDPDRKIQDAASYGCNGELAGVVLGEIYFPGGAFKTIFPGGVFKIIGADGTYTIINPDAQLGDDFNKVAVLARGVRVWQTFKAFEQELADIRAHPIVSQNLQRRQ